MRGAMGRALLLIFITVSLPVRAQLLKDLQRAVTNEAKALNTKENRDKFISAGLKAMEKARDVLFLLVIIPDYSILRKKERTVPE
jgi:hypothetical protein